MKKSTRRTILFLILLMASFFLLTPNVLETNRNVVYAGGKPQGGYWNTTTISGGVTLTYDFDNNSKQGWFVNAVQSTYKHSGGYAIQTTDTEGSATLSSAWPPGTWGTGIKAAVPYINLSFPEGVTSCNITFWWYQPAFWSYTDGADGYVLRWENTTVGHDQITSGKGYGSATWYQGPTFNLMPDIASGEVNDIRIGWILLRSGGGWGSRLCVYDDIVIKYNYSYSTSEWVVYPQDWWMDHIPFMMGIAGFFFLIVSIPVGVMNAKNGDWLSGWMWIVLLFMVGIGLIIGWLWS